MSQTTKFLGCANLSVRHKQPQTNKPNQRTKVQVHHDAVSENLGEYKHPWEIWCVIVTKVTTTDGDSESNMSYRAV